MDDDLLRTGTLARGNVVSVETTGLTTGVPEAGLGRDVVCVVTVEVVGLQGEQAYVASCRHAVPQVHVPRLQQAGAAVAVRVDPGDPAHITLDLGHDVPAAPVVVVSDDGTRQVVETHRGTATAAEILRDGSPCLVDVLAVIPLAQLTQDGLAATGLVLQVHRDGAAPYQAQIGLHVPDSRTGVVVAGARLPARWVPGDGAPTDVNLVTIDWPALN